jgi:hypothetical protein
MLHTHTHTHTHRKLELGRTALSLADMIKKNYAAHAQGRNYMELEIQTTMSGIVRLQVEVCVNKNK